MGRVERKVATVLFVDLVDSTGLVAAADPEVVRQRVNRYFEQVSHCIESHGGTVEKFAGDAVMAAFGVPLAHEDDAERALRAALAVVPAVEAPRPGRADRGRVRRGRRRGRPVDVRDRRGRESRGAPAAGRPAGRDPARPGRATPRRRRGRDGRARARSRSGAGRAGLGVARPAALETRCGSARRPSSAAGASSSCSTTCSHAAVRDRRAHLVNRVRRAGRGQVAPRPRVHAGLRARPWSLFGRALPYGEGITYFPLASMVKASAGIADDDSSATPSRSRARAARARPSPTCSPSRSGVRGAADGDGRGQELRWAARRWAEQLAEAQPLVLVFEDVHWAEEQLLDLLEDIARELRTGPLLIVTVARPELLEHRPTWAGGNPRALAVELGAARGRGGRPISPDALLERAEVPPAQRALAARERPGEPALPRGDGAHPHSRRRARSSGFRTPCRR